MSENMFLALEMLAQGMIGIFVVLGIIALLVLLMGKTGGKKTGGACFPIETLRGVGNLWFQTPSFIPWGPAVREGQTSGGENSHPSPPDRTGREIRFAALERGLSPCGEADKRGEEN